MTNKESLLAADIQRLIKRLNAEDLDPEACWHLNRILASHGYADGTPYKGHYGFYPKVYFLPSGMLPCSI